MPNENILLSICSWQPESYCNSYVNQGLDQITIDNQNLQNLHRDLLIRALFFVEPAKSIVKGERWSSLTSLLINTERYAKTFRIQKCVELIPDRMCRAMLLYVQKTMKICGIFIIWSNREIRFAHLLLGQSLCMAQNIYFGDLTLLSAGVFKQFPPQVQRNLIEFV